MDRFDDRTQAGRLLAERLAALRRDPEVVILGLPRGGVPVAYEVAEALQAPLDIFVVRKLGAPGQEELAMGAVATGGARVLNDDVVRALGIPDDTIERVASDAEREVRRRETLYRGDRPLPELRGRTVVLVDDGLATGASMRAAVQAVRSFEPARVLVAVPTAPADTCRALRELADECVCLSTPEPFMGVGRWYRDFSQTTDEEVRSWLAQAWSSSRSASGA